MALSPEIGLSCPKPYAMSQKTTQLSPLILISWWSLNQNIEENRTQHLTSSLLINRNVCVCVASVCNRAIRCEIYTNIYSA